MNMIKKTFDLTREAKEDLKKLLALQKKMDIESRLLSLSQKLQNTEKYSLQKKTGATPRF